MVVTCRAENSNSVHVLSVAEALTFSPNIWPNLNNEHLIKRRVSYQVEETFQAFTPNLIQKKIGVKFNTKVNKVKQSFVQWINQINSLYVRWNKKKLEKQIY